MSGRGALPPRRGGRHGYDLPHLPPTQSGDRLARAVFNHMPGSFSGSTSSVRSQMPFDYYMDSRGDEPGFSQSVRNQPNSMSAMPGRPNDSEAPELPACLAIPSSRSAFSPNYLEVQSANLMAVNEQDFEHENYEPGSEAAPSRGRASQGSQGSEFRLPQMIMSQSTVSQPRSSNLMQGPSLASQYRQESTTYSSDDFKPTLDRSMMGRDPRSSPVLLPSVWPASSSPSGPELFQAPPRTQTYSPQTGYHLDFNYDSVGTRSPISQAQMQHNGNAVTSVHDPVDVQELSIYPQQNSNAPINAYDPFNYDQYVPQGHGQMNNSTHDQPSESMGDHSQGEVDDYDYDQTSESEYGGLEPFPEMLPEESSPPPEEYSTIPSAALQRRFGSALDGQLFDLYTGSPLGSSIGSSMGSPASTSRHLEHEVPYPNQQTGQGQSINFGQAQLYDPQATENQPPVAEITLGGARSQYEAQAPIIAPPTFTPRGGSVGSVDRNLSSMRQPVHPHESSGRSHDRRSTHRTFENDIAPSGNVPKAPTSSFNPAAKPYTPKNLAMATVNKETASQATMMEEETVPRRLSGAASRRQSQDIQVAKAVAAVARLQLAKQAPKSGTTPEQVRSRQSSIGYGIGLGPYTPRGPVSAPHFGHDPSSSPTPVRARSQKVKPTSYSKISTTPNGQDLPVWNPRSTNSSPRRQSNHPALHAYLNPSDDPFISSPDRGHGLCKYGHGVDVGTDTSAPSSSKSDRFSLPGRAVTTITPMKYQAPTEGMLKLAANSHGNVSRAEREAAEHLMRLIGPDNQKPTVDVALDNDNIPFVTTARLCTPPLSGPGLVRVFNIPYTVTRQEITAFIGRNNRLLRDNEEPIHIVMERITSKTMDAYVEFDSLEDAVNAVSRYNYYRSTGHGGKLGVRHVNMEVCGYEKFMGDLFPKAKGVEWHGARAVIPDFEPSEDSLTVGFQGFVLKEELIMMGKHVEFPNRSIYSIDCPQRPFECLISTIKKYPWYLVDHILIEDRDALFTATEQLLKLLLKHFYTMGENIHLDHRLFNRVKAAALRCPGFSVSQKDNIAYICGMSAQAAGIAPHADHWRVFLTISPKVNFSPQVLDYYLALIREATTGDARKISLAERATVPNKGKNYSALFGELKITYPEDVQRKSIAEVAMIEWTELERVLRLVLPEPEPEEEPEEEPMMSGALDAQYFLTY